MDILVTSFLKRTLILMIHEITAHLLTNSTPLQRRRGDKTRDHYCLSPEMTQQERKKKLNVCKNQINVWGCFILIHTQALLLMDGGYQNLPAGGQSSFKQPLPLKLSFDSEKDKMTLPPPTDDIT